jgi:hypothetical protein
MATFLYFIPSISQDSSEEWRVQASQVPLRKDIHNLVRGNGRVLTMFRMTEYSFVFPLPPVSNFVSRGLDSLKKAISSAFSKVAGSGLARAYACS